MPQRRASRAPPGMSTKLLATGYQVGRPMFYTEHPVGIFFMDRLAREFFNGQLSGWGTDLPILQPTAASVGAGQLPAGTYQFALTFVRDDGSESGTRRAGVVTATGAIAFSNIEVSADPNVVQKQIYVSSPDGETLYLSLILPPAATTATFSGGIIGATLETMFKTPPPNGSVLAEHNGRILVGFGKYIAYSSAFRPERFDIARQAIPCEDTVRIIAPVQTGVFVGTDSAIFYLDGADIDAASTTALADYGAVPGSLVYVDGDLVGASGRCALFLTAQGVVLCTPGGNFKNLTRDRYWPAASPRAGAVFIREAGRSRYLASLMSS